MNAGSAHTLTQWCRTLQGGSSLPSETFLQMPSQTDTPIGDSKSSQVGSENELSQGPRGLSGKECLGDNDVGGGNHHEKARRTLGT